MKIGIITPYEEANYGAYLQAYANMIYLKSQGHEVFFIKWRTDQERKKAYFENKTNLIARIKKMIRVRHNIDNYKKMTNALEVFQVLEVHEILEKKLDMILLGSDEIWNIKYKIFQNSLFYGGNIQGVPIYAYAPSAGNASKDDYMAYPEICELMKKVNIIGVRDENTVKVVNDMCGTQSKLVCDPTLLLTIDDYQSKPQHYVSQPYILVYSYFVDRQSREYLIRYAKEKNLKLVSACMYQAWCDINMCCEPLEFISLIKDAAYVYTTTFHGSIFTLFHHKKCLVYAESKKLKDLISWTGMESVLFAKDGSYEKFVATIETEHNYDIFEERVSARRNNSREIYSNALQGVK